MKKNVRSNYWNIFLLLVFCVTVGLVLTVGLNYKKSQTQSSLQQLYSKTADKLTNKLDVLIEEKKNATLTIALSLTQNPLFQQTVLKRENIHNELAQFSQELKQNTDFKNVWIQLIDKGGVVLSRSWTEDIGESLKKIRFEIPKMINKPEIKSLVSIGKYDLSFKAMVPLYDSKAAFIGFLEVITHFNSIATKMKEEDVSTVVLVDKSYKKQIVHPFSQTFIDDYYVANINTDFEVLSYIDEKGVDEIVSYKEKYITSSEDEYLRVNYTLFDLNSKPMAYVVMFKKIQNLDMAAIKNANFVVDIIMLFLVVLMAFILLFLVKKEHKSVDLKIQNLKYVFLFSLLFVALTVIFYLLLHTYKENEKNEFLKNHNSNIEKDYEIISKKFEIIAETMFEDNINNQKVLKLIKRAYSEDKDLARAELYDLLKRKYTYFSSYDVKQLHFHLKNNESFLRFHRPQKYGDNLTGVRATVEFVNLHHEKIQGFEEGRIYNGFRYLFPLFVRNIEKQKEYVGSVEVSFNAHAIANDFAESHNTKVAFLISKDVVKKKLFNDEKMNYSLSEFQDFYYEKSVKKTFEKAFKNIDISKVSTQDVVMINSKIKEGKTFSLAPQDTNTLCTILPFKNPLSHQVVAAIVLQSDNNILNNQNELFILIFSIGTILLLLMTIFMYREFTTKQKFQHMALKTQNILDTQKSIIIITNGVKILDANKKFFEFFGHASLESFFHHNSCICDFFVEDSSYYHLGKVPRETNWIDFIQEVASKDRVVLMKDLDGLGHSFAMTFSNYQSSYYIITFTDISGTIEEQLVLENKVLHDKLTGAYNREFFETKSSVLVAQNQVNGRFLGIIFFDIDHFKDVNDTYGHNVGDNILKELVKRVTESIRSSDYLIRWGGEEFLVLVSTTSLDQLESTAQHLRSMIANHHFEDVQQVTCSFGVTLSLHNESITSTVQRADEALYTSKANGRNQVTKL
jgi:diguanylate cyclase (GGDEF)-like protein